MTPAMRPLLALVHLLLVAATGVVVVTVFETKKLAIETAIETDLVLAGVATAALASLALRGPIDALLESIRPLRPLDTASALYALVCVLVLFGLLLHEGRPDTPQAVNDFRQLAALLLVLEIPLLALAGTRRGLGLATTNGLVLVVIATVVEPAASPACLLYVLLAALVMVARHHLHELALAPRQEAIPLWPVLRHLAWTTMVLLALMVALVPALPELRADLSFTLPDRRRTFDLVEVVMRFLAAAALFTLAVWLVRGVLGRARHRPRRGPATEAESLESLLVNAEVERTRPPLTRRFLRLRLSARERIVEEFCAWLERMVGYGLARPPHQTAHEFAQRFARARPAAEVPAQELAALFCRARYTERECTPADAQRAHALARDLVDAAREGAGAGTTDRRPSPSGRPP